MKLYYGRNHFVDVSYILERKELPFKIEANDVTRYKFFNIDPEGGVIKVIKIIDDYGREEVIPQGYLIIVYKDEKGNKTFSKTLVNEENVVDYLHSKIKLEFGNVKEEFNEQLLAAKYITPEMKVLEIGSNIGRNTVLISHLLKDSKQLVTVESDPKSSSKLKINRDNNNLHFTIIPAAISNKRLIQQFWESKVFEGSVIPAGWYEVATIPWRDLYSQHGPFDTLVADCEGALYNILKDEPSFAERFTTVIVENDYNDMVHKEFVDSLFLKAGLRVVEQRGGGWGPCEKFFYEVWKK